jgi:cation diffusion facilitator family transporter
MNEKLKFGIIALGVIIFQSILKVLGVIITQSLSFLSESIDTLVDIFFVALTLYSIYISQKPADFEHMYGHQKIDSIGGMIQGIILVNIYIILIYNAIQTILSQTSVVENPTIGLQLLIVSMIVNLIISQILIWQGKKKKSLSLKMQGLNLFQDSLRAIIILVNFVLIVFFNISSLDPYFSIVISIVIIISAFKLIKEGINNIIDINPVSAMVLKELQDQILTLPHVNGVETIRIRSSGNKLFLELNIAVEDHISIAHADEISKAIRPMIKNYLPTYDVETIIELNPLSSEASLGEKIINLIYSLKADYPEIVEIRDLNVFQVERKYFISLVIIVNNNLTLKNAHEKITEFEQELQKQIPLISRIISHIEAKDVKLKPSSVDMICEKVNSEQSKKLKQKAENILKTKSYVKGYHGFEFWNISDFCIIELHVFFDGNINISKIHNYTSELEDLIKHNINIDDLKEVIIHAEPIEGRSNGNIF